MNEQAPLELLAQLVDSGTTSGLLDVVLARAKELGRPGTMPAPLLLEAVNSARRDPDVLRILSEQVTGREDLSPRSSPRPSPKGR